MSGDLSSISNVPWCFPMKWWLGGWRAPCLWCALSFHPPAILPAHKIYPAALSKCPNQPPLSQLLTHFHWHTMATFACPKTTLWPNCGVFVEQGQGTKPSAIFDQKCKTWESWECAGAQGGRTGASATTPHVHHPDSSFPGSSRMIFWRGFSTQRELQINHHQ